MNLTEAQRKMLIDSEPDDRTGEEGCGVELLTGADYAVAKSLKHRELGSFTGPGGSLPGMYWSNADGLRLRADLMGYDEDGLDDEPEHDCGEDVCVCADPD